MIYTSTESCRVCGNTELQPSIDLGELALTGVFPRPGDPPVPVGPLRLVRCSGAAACGLVQLAETFRPELMYGDNYGYRSGLNPSMVRHLRGKVDRILSLHNAEEGSVVLDIGSNDGTTLGSYPEGRFSLVGIDPTAEKFSQFYRTDIKVVADFFDSEVYRASTNGKPASIITSFSMFYDLENPITFMEDVARILEDTGIWVFEQSYLPLMLDRNAYDTICHEHIEYYHLTPIVWMAQQTGLRIVDVETNDINGGSFSVVATKSPDIPISDDVGRMLDAEARLAIDSGRPLQEFERRIAESRDQLRQFILGEKSNGRSVAGLGASTKGNVLLQYCGLTANELDAIGEINPDKVGRITPGSAIPIVDETELLKSRPDNLLVLPWHFRDTFVSKDLAPGSSMVFPLPELEVVE